MREGQADDIGIGAVERRLPPGIEHDPVRGPVKTFGGDAEAIVGRKERHPAPLPDMKLAAVRHRERRPVVRHHLDRPAAKGQQTRELHQESQIPDRMVLPEARRPKNVDFSYFRIIRQDMAHRLDEVVVLLLVHLDEAGGEALLQSLRQRIHVTDDGVRQPLRSEMVQPFRQRPVTADRPLRLFQQVQRVGLFRKKAVAEYGGATAQRDEP